MDCSIEEYEDRKTNGLGFSGGPTWCYPEEEIEFYEVEEDESLAEDSDIESVSCSSMDKFRITMIENYIETHDILEDGDIDMFFGCDRNDYALSQPPPSVSIIQRSTERTSNDVDLDDHSNTSDLSSSGCSNSISSSSRNKRSLPEISPSSIIRKRASWVQPSSKRRRRPEKVSISCDTTATLKEKHNLFREATMCVPFEYTTKLATFYIRRPYGAVTVPEMFRALCPHVTNEEYERKSQVSSSKTIQVAISVKADKSMMLLYGSAGVRYKSDHTSDDWVDVPDTGMMDNPLGYVNSCNIEYSLDEILEEAMFVREQYCSAIMSTAYEVEQSQMSTGPTKALSPPSLAKSIVSTPPRISYYYDGSSNNAKAVEEEEEIKGRKLDFLQCISPSLMTKGSIGTTSGFAQRQRKRRQKQVYRFFQRLFIVIGFYICAIFLVGNLCGVEYKLPSSILPQSDNTVFAMFLNTAEDSHGDKKTNSEIVGEDAIDERIKRDHDAAVKKVADERDNYKHNLETAQELLWEKEEQNYALSEKYDFERTKTAQLQKDMENAATLVKNLLHETERLAVDLEIEQEQNRKFERTLQELENQITFLIQDKIRMESLLMEATEQPSMEESPEISVQVLENTISIGNNDTKQPIESKGLVLVSPQNAMHPVELSKGDKNKVQVFASSLKDTVTKNVKKILRTKKKKKKKNRSQMDRQDFRDSDAYMAQYRPLNYLDNNKEIREMLMSSTKKVLKLSKENLDMVRHTVKRNVDEVPIVGIKKMDHGQEAIKVVGAFAKSKLQSVGKRARKFASNNWGQKQRNKRSNN